MKPGSKADVPSDYRIASQVVLGQMGKSTAAANMSNATTTSTRVVGSRPSFVSLALYDPVQTARLYARGGEPSQVARLSQRRLLTAAECTRIDVAFPHGHKADHCDIYTFGTVPKNPLSSKNPAHSVEGKRSDTRLYALLSGVGRLRPRASTDRSTSEPGLATNTHSSRLPLLGSRSRLDMCRSAPTVGARATGISLSARTVLLR